MYCPGQGTLPTLTLLHDLKKDTNTFGAADYNPSQVVVEVTLDSCPSKACIFMWLLLNNKIPTWDILQREKNYSFGWCSLCSSQEESNFHLLIDCTFAKEVWKEAESILEIDPI